MPRAATPRRAPRKPRPARPLNREKIAAAAIELAREEGQAAVTMRQVAARLGVDVAALYRHFRNKDELLGEVGRVASEIAELHAPQTGSWEERFLELCSAIRDRLLRHPELGVYGGGSPWATPFIARANGLIAALFVEAGMRDVELLYATQAVLHTVTAVAQSEVLTRATSPAENRRFGRIVAEQLPPEVREVWPREPVRRGSSIEFDAFFRFVLRAMLNAIAPGAPPTAASG
jgi:AcrR family transcriptional regulator